MYQIQLNDNGYCIGFVLLPYLDEGFIEVPQNLYPTDISYSGRKFDVENMQWLDEYADWYTAPPKPALSEAEQRELDRDELLLDNVINDQQIILMLETGGDKA